MNAEIKAIGVAATALAGVAVEGMLSTGNAYIDAVIGLALVGVGWYVDGDYGLFLIGFGMGYGVNAILKALGI
jgi:hypothetical protein